MKTTVKELRIILTVDNLDELIRFYRDTVGLETSKEWHEEAGNGIILDAGRASLELIDKKHAERIDQIEVGKRVAGPVRLALRVNEPITSAAESWLDGGAVEVAPSTTAPWSEVARVEAPDGMQITLFTTSTLADT
ncbi:VOC family protein [Spirosoma sp.]|uniref:VOC family protein n=1 Tax=Spirosoma sp. TaxID=1899569 RepID=UPI003B3AF55E